MLNDTEIVYRDLSDAFEQLDNEKTSPLAVRRKFRNFVIYTQQLTEMMRKEFPQRTGKKWEAKNFDGWNDVSLLFKEIRKSDYHEVPLLIQVKETRSYQMNKIFTDSSSDNLFNLQSIWNLDPFSEDVPQCHGIVLADEATGEPLDEFIEPHKIEYQFVLLSRTTKTKTLLENIGDDDLHELSRQFFVKLQVYYDFYQQSVQKN